MLRASAHVHWSPCDSDNTAVLNLRSGEWQMITGIGTRVWNTIAVYGEVDGLAEEIAIPAGLDPAATAHAIDTYVEQLCAMGLLVKDRPRPRTRWWWRRRR